MKLSKIALLAIKGAKGSRRRLAEALNVSEQSIRLYLKDNNDILTKAAALAVIREMTGLSDDVILEAEAIAN